MVLLNGGVVFCCLDLLVCVCKYVCYWVGDGFCVCEMIKFRNATFVCCIAELVCCGLVVFGCLLYS